MSVYPGQPAPAAPKRTLTWIAVGCFVIGALLTGFFVVRIVQTAPRTPQPIEGGVVHLKKEGLTVYASVPVLTPPCEARDAAGNDVPLKPPSGSENITINGETWYVVARSVNPVPAGDYSVSCTDNETSATYAAGPRSSVVAFVVAILGTVFSFLIFVGLGIVLLGIDLIKRARRKRRTNTFPGGPGFPGNQPPPGPYPRSGTYAQPGGYSQSGSYPQPGTHSQSGSYPQPGTYSQPGGYPQPGSFPESGYSQSGGYPASGNVAQPGPYPQQGSAEPGAYPQHGGAQPGTHLQPGSNVERGGDVQAGSGAEPGNDSPAGSDPRGDEPSERAFPAPPPYNPGPDPDRPQDR